MFFRAIIQLFQEVKSFHKSDAQENMRASSK